MRRPEFFFKSELCFVCFIRAPENVFTSTIAYLLSVSNCLWMAFDRFCSKLVTAFELDGECGQEMYFVFLFIFEFLHEELCGCRLVLQELHIQFLPLFSKIHFPVFQVI